MQFSTTFNFPIACSFPTGSLSNDELSVAFPEWSADKISEKTGIYARGIVQGEESGLDLAVKACEALFKQYDILKQEIDYLVYCTQSPEYALPPNSTLLQDCLGLSGSIGAVDISHGCSGYVYTLSVAKGLVSSGQADNVLVVTSETYSRYLDPKDKGTRAIFGDGATATLVTKEVAQALSSFVFATDGSGWKHLYRRNRNFLDIPLNQKNDALYMNGPAIYTYTLKTVPEMLTRILEKNNMSFDDLDLVFFHQANRHMLEALRRKCGIPVEKFPIALRDTGNTVSSSIPMAMKKVMGPIELRSGMCIALVGFGVGLSSAGCLISV